MKINFSIILLLILISCSSSKEKQSQDDTHNSFNSLDWEGTYIGTLPCDDCKEIRKRITLHEDLTYEISTEYIGSDKPTELVQKGSFEWYNNGSCIALKIDIPKLLPFNYKVGENTLISLNKDSEVNEKSVKYTKLSRIE